MSNVPTNATTLHTLAVGLFGSPGESESEPGRGIELVKGRGRQWTSSITCAHSWGPKRPERPIFWLDRLLKGGIRIPRGLNRPLRILIKGAPGLGKSLFVQQLLYSRLFRPDAVNWPKAVPNDPPFGPPDGRWHEPIGSFYTTTESSPWAVLDNLNSLGMHLEEGLGEKEPGLQQRPAAEMAADFWPLTHLIAKLRSGDTGVVAPGDLSTGSRLILARYPEAAHVGRASMEAGLTQTGDLNAAHRKVKVLQYAVNEIAAKNGLFAFAFDSVNSLLDTMTSDRVMMKLLDWPSSDAYPACTIFIYDEEHADSGARWAHAADMILQFHESWSNGFVHHDFEIQKARFQNHVMGRHPYTIYGVGGGDSLSRILENSDVSGPRPRLREGGIFIFPNHHYLIDEMRQLDGLRFFASDKELKPPVAAPCGKAAFRAGACVLLLGALGSRRRQYIVSTMWKAQREAESNGCDDARTLLVSFAERTHWFNRMLAGLDGKDWNDKTSDHERSAMLRRFPRLLQRPGSVLPAALLNRLVYWLIELKPRIVGIVGLDGLAALFPELAAEPQFVPAMLEILRAHEVVTFVPVAGVVEANKGQLTASYGLPGMANYVLGFKSNLEIQDELSITWHKDDDGWHDDSWPLRQTGTCEGYGSWNLTEPNPTPAASS